ncbi:TRAP transporter solute receptor, TAXI family [Polaromonas sp. OV174]|uniref:TAXI family TRAP transporter solute-binding subunit n=1 Tax=Polaromonas sp. OV174 TaxID=1855300 RepID=UPI0008EDFBAE|nr:TAXI family TRAP transporter solute-binding subunit [Polaromonas sp. OV174]SFB73645.1 TRAP transporter solute receptor, TAXI family [Polaromonas sp. OV174]
MLLIPSLTRKHTLLLTVLIVAGLAVALSLLSRSISPAPPRTAEMTTGAVEGAVHQFALKYQSYLKANGVSLKLLPSTGAVQNLERLHAGTAIGFMQSGLGQLTLEPADDYAETPLRSLGVMGYEPVWIFTQAALAGPLGKGLGPLAGKKVAIGPKGSGTRKVALEVLQNYGVTAANATLTPDSGLAAAKALMAKELDALVLIGAPQTPAVQLLLAQPSVQLVSLTHAEGLTRRLPYLSRVTLPAGSVDPAQDLPHDDITLLTTTANLVVQHDLHPALAYLLLEAAHEIHRGGTLLNKPDEFPRQLGTDYPLADEAARYYKDGRPFLQRYLPYWAANALQRLLLVLVPLVAIAVPLFRVLPFLFEFREKSRLYRRYGALLEMERDIQARQLSADEIAQARVKLDQIELDVSHMKFSLDFSDRVYTLRQHVDYVRRQLQAHGGEWPTDTAHPASPGKPPHLGA